MQKHAQVKKEDDNRLRTDWHEEVAVLDGQKTAQRDSAQNAVGIFEHISWLSPTNIDS